MPLPLGYARENWWAPRDLNSDSPKGNWIYSPAQQAVSDLTPISRKPESRTQSGFTPWHVSSVLAYHLPRSRWHFRVRHDLNAVRWVWNPNCSPKSTPVKWRKVPESNGHPGGAPLFKTGGRPFRPYVPFQTTGSRSQIRTETVLFLRQTPPANWANRPWSTRRESNTHWRGCNPPLCHSGSSA